ncbi:MAG: DUF4209 domain-containing protein, partial [Acidimicrobiales bacterium]
SMQSHSISDVLRSWILYFQVALVEPLGMNIRNVYAHGLVEEGGQELHSAVLIHIALALSRVEIVPSVDDASVDEP